MPRRMSEFDRLQQRLLRQSRLRNETIKNIDIYNNNLLVAATGAHANNTCKQRKARRAVLLNAGKVNKPGGAPGKNGHYVRTINSTMRCK